MHWRWGDIIRWRWGTGWVSYYLVLHGRWHFVFREGGIHLADSECIVHITSIFLLMSKMVHLNFQHKTFGEVGSRLQRLEVHYW